MTQVPPFGFTQQVKSNITLKSKIQEEALYFYVISNGKIGSKDLVTGGNYRYL
jgi:hypothetical protein